MVDLTTYRALMPSCGRHPKLRRGWAPLLFAGTLMLGVNPGSSAQDAWAPPASELMAVPDVQGAWSTFESARAEADTRYLESRAASESTYQDQAADSFATYRSQIESLVGRVEDPTVLAALNELIAGSTQLDAERLLTRIEAIEHSETQRLARSMSGQLQTLQGLRERRITRAADQHQAAGRAAIARLRQSLTNTIDELQRTRDDTAIAQAADLRARLEALQTAGAPPPPTVVEIPVEENTLSPLFTGQTMQLEDGVYETDWTAADGEIRRSRIIVQDGRHVLLQVYRDGQWQMPEAYEKELLPAPEGQILTTLAPRAGQRAWVTVWTEAPRSTYSVEQWRRSDLSANLGMPTMFGTAQRVGQLHTNVADFNALQDFTGQLVIVGTPTEDLDPDASRFTEQWSVQNGVIRTHGHRSSGRDYRQARHALMFRTDGLTAMTDAPLHDAQGVWALEFGLDQITARRWRHDDDRNNGEPPVISGTVFLIWDADPNDLERYD